MGCRASKVDDLPLVIRCRERKKLIKAAAEARYDFSSSHLAYFHSLKDIGYALSRFVDEQLVIPSPTPSSPVLTLPSDLGKTNNGSMSSGSISHIHSIDDNENSESDLSSSSDGHIHIHDGGSENKPPASSFNHPRDYNKMNPNDPYVINGGSRPYQPPWGSDQPNWGDPYVINRGPQPYQPSWGDPYGVNVNPSAFPDRPSWGPNQSTLGEGGPYVMDPSASQYQPPWGTYQEDFDSYSVYGNSNHYASYMKKSAPASRTVIQHAEARDFQETGQWVDPPHYDPYQSGGIYEFSYGGPPPPQEPKRPKSPPPPPPPVESDYFNFFDAYGNGYGFGYGSMGSSPDSSEVREREGIPDLEEETETESHHEEVLKGNTFNRRRNSCESTSRSVAKEDTQGREAPNSTEGSSRRIPPRKSGGSLSSVPSENNEGAQSVNSEVDKHSPETVVSQSMGKGYENKKGESFDIDEVSTHEFESSILSSLTTLSAHGSRDLQEVVNEIKDEFDSAFGYGKEVALMLEAGKLPYQSRFAVLKVVLSRILYPLGPPFASSDHPIQSARSCSRVMKLAGSYNVDAVPDVGFTNLSSTLEKLYVWEKRLYKEVKDEERLRVMYEKMCKRLNELDAHGAESSKIDAAQTSIRRLSTKLNVSIKAIDAISSEIHKVRDKELQPQVSELIYGLIRMWQSVVKCHRKQFEAFMESRSRTLRANTSLVSLRAVLELQTVLITWCQHFNDWIDAQKSYVDSLNGWLQHCIDHEPEVTIDGEIPYSPGRIGAPPIFVICNDWHREISGISQDRVSKAIHGFASNLRQLLERQDNIQRLMLKKEYLAKDFARKHQNVGKKTRDSLADKTGGSMVPSDSGVDLDSLRKVEEEWERHKEAAMKLVDKGSSTSLQGGVIPIFKALENFTCDALKAHEQVRLQQQS
ncbi:protein of unknown function DUF630 [Cynara cardunculus var. scolymus]|uniref:DUF632 domain-containing protein n=1 Tax=Cynara cardunculus var. scolymus TaxID=59895 RepID=A0A103V350_CYNCS|nr:protein of unknown function DUF630 [Cynara cardunculus var. scolymus]